MSELRDTLHWAETVERSFEEQSKTNEAQAAVNKTVEDKLRVHDTHFATIDRAQQTFENQIDVFRDAIREEFRRLREGITSGRN